MDNFSQSWMRVDGDLRITLGDLFVCWRRSNAVILCDNVWHMFIPCAFSRDNMIIRLLHCQDTTTQRILQKKHQSFQPMLQLQDQPVLGKITCPNNVGKAGAFPPPCTAKSRLLHWINLDHSSLQSCAFWAEGHGQNLFWTLPAWRHHMTFHDGCIATSSRSQVQMSPTPWCSLLPSIQSSRCNWKCRGRWRQRARILVRNNIVTFTDNSWAGHCYIVIWIIIMLNKLFHSTPKENGKIKQQMESVCKESAGGCPRFPRAATNKTRKLMGALETAGQGSSFHLVHYLSRPPLETCTKSGTTKQPNHANSFPKQHMFTAAGWICWSPIQRSCHSRGATGCLCHNSIQESKSVSQFIGWTLGKDHAAHRNHHAKNVPVARGPQWSRMAPEGRAAMFNLKKWPPDTTRIHWMQLVLLHTLCMTQMVGKIQVRMLQEIAIVTGGGYPIQTSSWSSL